MAGKNLGWAWRPDAATRAAEARNRARTSQRKRDKKRKGQKKSKRVSRYHFLLFAPSEIFYDSREWQKLRSRVLVAYGRKCMRCQAVDTEMHIDHIKPRSRFPWLSLKFANLQVLCRNCNMDKSNKNTLDYREEALARDLDRQVILEMYERFPR